MSEYHRLVPNLVAWLLKRNKSVYFCDSTQDRVEKFLKSNIKKVNFLPLHDLHKDVDLAITLGGDGTLLGFARKSSKTSAPIFGVNLGHLGFIAEFSKAEFFEELESIFSKKVEVEKMKLFKVEVFRKDKKALSSYFLNDAVFSKNDISRMFSLNIENETQLIYSTRGDGLIISSPTGSTAYSLAAGGPIIHPRVDALTLTPICPHSLTNRPIVIPSTEKLSLKIPAGSEDIMMTLDGQEAFSLEEKDIVKISRSHSRYARIIKNSQKDYFQNLRDKFTYGKRMY